MSYEAAHERFVERLEGIREKRGMTRKAFSLFLDLSPYTYDYYVTRGGMPNLYTAMVIAEKLGMTLDQMLGIGGKK